MPDVSIIFKIAELLKGLNTQKKEAKKKLFENFIQPAMDDLELVHNDYIKTFLEYAHCIETENVADFQNHPVFKLIKRDSILSAHLRQKLYSFYDHSTKDALKRFASYIAFYLGFMTEHFTEEAQSVDDSTENYLQVNIGRKGLYSYLKSVFAREKTKAKKKEKGLAFIDSHLESMQHNYRSVIDAYNQIKRELLL